MKGLRLAKDEGGGTLILTAGFLFIGVLILAIIVDFGSGQFIIELKRWKGEAGQENAYSQLLEYMHTKNMKNGYLLTFDFRKTGNKINKAEWVSFDGKKIFEIML